MDSDNNFIFFSIFFTKNYFNINIPIKYINKKLGQNNNFLYICIMKKLILTITFLISFVGVSQTSKKESVTSIEHINFIGLNLFDSTVLVNSSNYIGQYLNCNTNISDKSFPIESFLTKGPKFLKVEQFMSSVKNDTLTVYITNRSLMYDGVFAKGVSSPCVSTILVDGRKGEINSIIIHEVGHILGLDHCDNEGCVMSNNFSEPTPRFCNLCHINFFK